jgi:hypothetical protein
MVQLCSSHAIIVQVYLWDIIVDTEDAFAVMVDTVLGILEGRRWRPTGLHGRFGFMGSLTV